MQNQQTDIKLIEFQVRSFMDYCDEVLEYVKQKKQRQEEMKLYKV